MDTTKQATNYFNYNRKSTTDERQILSLPAQEKAMTDMATKFNLKIRHTFKESKSAKEPNKRPVFSEMIQRIKSGEANGILCWELSRLARNPDEAGLIIGMLQRGEIKHIRTYAKDYYPDDNSVLSFVEFGIANQSSRDLSTNVKRGINTKANMGWRPTKAPLGYLNSKKEEKGKQFIYNDPERFHLVKQVFQMMLTGNYSGPKLLEYVNGEMCLRLPESKNRVSRKVHLSELYRILTNPFYYGWYEWVKDSNDWIQGKHEPMITEVDYDRIQFLLGRDGRPRPKTHKFAFTGIMRCGACGAGITAEEKFKKQKNGNIHHYIYYHCTRRKDPNCVERAMEIKDFNGQIDKVLKGLTISDRFQKWALTYLHELRKQEAKAHESGLEMKHKRLEQVVRQLDSVMLKYTSPDNADGSLMSDGELKTLKSGLLKEKAGLEAELNTKGKEISQWVELTERTFNFARYARVWFAKGDMETKRAIFACLGSDFIVADKKVRITIQQPFKSVFDGLPLAINELERLEPIKNHTTIRRMEDFVQQFPILSG
jgi:DNA invertase Pin-like site-specific DNA recombinase